jgi:hypothetical protein
MTRVLLALLNGACALFSVDSRCLARKEDAARNLSPESFGR